MTRAEPVSLRSPSSVSFSDRVRQGAARERLGVGIEGAGMQHPLHEPRDRAADPPLERGRRPDVRAQPLEQELVAQRLGRRIGRSASAGASGMPSTAPSGRRSAPAQEALLEQVADVVDEQRPRARLAVVVGDVPAEDQPLLGAREGGVEADSARPRARPAAARARSPETSASRRRSSSASNGRGPRAGGEDALLQSAHEQRAHAPRAQRQRVEHGDRTGSRAAGAVAAVDLAPARAPARAPRPSAGASSRCDPGELPQLPERAPARRERARLVALVGREHLRLAAPAARRTASRAHAPPRSSRLRRSALLSAARAGRSPRVASCARSHSSLARCALERAGPPGAELEPVGQRSVLEQAGCPQPREQVSQLAPRGAVPAPARSGARRRSAPPIAVSAKRRGACSANGIPAAAKTSSSRSERRARRARQHGDLLGRHARRRAARRSRRRRARARPARRRPPAGARPSRRRPGLRRARTARRSRWLERAARRRRVVLGARLERQVLVGERRERLERRGAPGEGRAAGLVGERHGHLRPDDPAERLDRVELQPREVVEAVEEHRRAAPERRALSQRVERRDGPLLGVEPAEAARAPRGSRRTGVPSSDGDAHGAVRGDPARERAA